MASMEDIQRDLGVAEDILQRVGASIAGSRMGVEKRNIGTGPAKVVSASYVAGVADEVSRIEEQAAGVREMALRIEELVEGYDEGKKARVDVPGPNRR